MFQELVFVYRALLAAYHSDQISQPFLSTELEDHLDLTGSHLTEKALERSEDSSLSTNMNHQ